MAKLCAVLAVAFLFPPAAAAHLRSGTVAVDYRPRIVRAPGGPVSVGVYLSDRALHLSVANGHSLVVYGYLGEPLLRIRDVGAAVATSSPTAAATRLVVHGRSAVWHDVRTSRTRWSVPVEIDGVRTSIVGITQRLARPRLWLWLVLLVAAALAGARGSPAMLGTISAAAAIVVAAAFALSTYASPGTWIAGVDEFFFAAAGFGVLRWGPPVARLPAALWLSLLGVAVGLSKGQVFLHSLALAALPGTFTRALTTIAIGAGVTGAALACRSYIRSERAS
ncbi:MAG TPA: hypothetical protein VIE38_11670 [Gaiellaceae bacterium]